MVKSRPKNLSCSGFSLVELIVTLCVVTLFIAVAVPSMTAITRAQNKRAGRESFEAFLKKAQATAMSKGARVILTPNGRNSSYTFGIDYPPYNSPVNPDATTGRLNLPLNITITTSARIVFDSRGRLVNSSGAATSSSLTLNSNGSSFATGTLYTTGSITYN